MIVGRTGSAAFFAPDGAPPGGGGSSTPPGGAAPPAAGAPGGGAAPPPGGSPPSVPPPAAKSFADTLPEDIRAEAAFKDIKDLDGLARGFHGQAKLLGVPKDQLLKLPGPDADEKALAEVYTRLGRPESAEKYVLKPAEGQQFTETDKAFHAAILPAVHAAGLNQRQLDVITGAWNQYAAKVVEGETARTAAGIEAASAALKADWGAAFPQRLERASMALDHFAGEAKIDRKALGAELERDALGNRPALAKLLDHLGSQLEEDGVLKGRAAGAADLTGPTEAKQQIAALASDAAFQKAYRDKDHPGHADAIKRRAALYEIAYPASA